MYIDRVEQIIADFKDIKMFGTVLEMCGFGFENECYKYTNACVVEYHVEMFNKKEIKDGLLNVL